jgi:hypothetical protein
VTAHVKVLSWNVECDMVDTIAMEETVKRETVLDGARYGMFNKVK